MGEWGGAVNCLECDRKRTVTLHKHDDLCHLIFNADCRGNIRSCSLIVKVRVHLRSTVVGSQGDWRLDNLSRKSSSESFSGVSSPAWSDYTVSNNNQ